MQKQVCQVGIKAQDIRKARKLEREEIMAGGVKHYFKNGKEHKGATHKDAKGRVMSGKTHTASSKFLVHMKDLSDTAKKKAKSA
jgi:hypothetical protein